MSTAEDVAKTITLTGTDADGDSLTFKVSTLPASGQLYDGTGTGGHHVVAGDLPYTVTDGAGKVTFDPTADFNGSDNFAFLANDGTVNSAGAATVNVTVTEVNDAPDGGQRRGHCRRRQLGHDQRPGQRQQGPGQRERPEPHHHRGRQAVGGTVAISGTNVIFTPTADYNGPDSFSYTFKMTARRTAWPIPRPARPRPASQSPK